MDGSTLSRNAPKALSSVVTVASLGLWALVVFYAYTQSMPRQGYSLLFLILILIIYWADEFAEDVESGERLQGVLLSASTIVALPSLVYLYLNVEELYTSRVGYATTNEYVLAFGLTLAILYYTWRSFGRGFLGVLLFAILYGLFGQSFPGILAHSGISPTRLMLILVLEIEGFLGSLLRLVAAWVALFLLYAGLMQGYGLFDLLLRVAAKSRKYVSSGVAQSAVIGSVAIGSIMGSQTANTGMTGSFTIPLMQENGMKGTTAGGIESVASTLGQILPPVMGAAAFIMPSLIPGITYWDVVRAGIVPAAVILISVIIAVHYAGIKQLESNVANELIEGTLTRWRQIVESLRFGLPFGVLLWALGVQQYTVMTSGLYASVSMLLLGVFAPVFGMSYAILRGRCPAFATESESNRDGPAATSTRIGDDTVSKILRLQPLTVFVKQIQKSVGGAQKGAVILAPIVIIIMAINGIVDIMNVTGVANIIALSLYDLSGGYLIVAAVLSMVISLLLGLGMPTIASYSLVALLIAPGLISQFGTPDLAAHYLVFYGAVLAGITPPIATCCAVAAGISESSFLRTCYESIKIAAPMFLLPISFVYYPSIVSGELSVTLLRSMTPIILGSVSIAYGLNAPFPFGKKWNYLVRAGYALAGLVLIVHPDAFVKMFAGGLFVLIAVGTLVLQSRPPHGSEQPM
jgi:TRAP transporter 4TM/12TM fusion protein